MTVFTVILQHYDYVGDARNPTWNEVESWLVDGTESALADFCHKANVQVINDARAKAEKTMNDYQSYIFLEEKRRETWEALSEEQRAILKHNVYRNHDVAHWQKVVDEAKVKLVRLDLWDMSEIYSHNLVDYRWEYKETEIWNLPDFQQHIEKYDD